MEGYELSGRQKTVWRSQEQTSGGAPYRAECDIRIHGSLDVELLRSVLKNIATRHEILRTRFVRLPGMSLPVQVIGPELAELRCGDRNQWDGNAPFDYEHGPLWRLQLTASSSREQVLNMSLPALCADSASLDNIVREVQRGYAAGLQDAHPDPLQYADYAAASTNEAPLPVVQAPFRPAGVTREIDSDVAERLAYLSGSRDAGLALLLQACWAVLLWRRLNKDVVTISRRLNGRTNQEELEAIGLFSRFSASAIQLDDSMRLDDVTRAIREALETATNAPDASFVIEDAAESYSDGATSFTIQGRYVCTDRFTLKLICTAGRAALRTDLHYDVSLYSQEEVERIAEEFAAILRSAAENFNGSIGDLNILGESERRRLLVDFNGVCRETPRAVAAHVLVERQAAQRPDHPAVVCGSETITYGELNERANAIAGYLATRGARPGKLIALRLERSIDLIAAILGTLKTGATYLPIDSSYPADRIAFTLEDAQPHFVVTEEAHHGEFPRDFQAKVPVNSLAYVIYTSASTGKPKGVAISHYSLFHYLESMRIAVGVTPEDRYLHTASFAFSSSVRQLFLPLSAGATVALAKSDEIRDPIALFGLIKQAGVTVIDIVPAYWRAANASLLGMQTEGRRLLLRNDLRLILSASESLLSDVPHAWEHDLEHGAKRINMFGQTETAGILSVYPIPSGEKTAVHSVPIGRPIANVKMYVLDGRMRPAPIGVPGELYAGGPTLAAEYYRRPELTCERFVPDPFSSDCGARLYKTGDRARYLPDGNIEHLGRMDDQVKIRGCRVEPKETEAALLSHPGVHAAVVTTQREEPGESSLVAYVAPKKEFARHAGGHERYTLPNNMAIAHLNKHETDFFYQQIFADQTNFRHGVSLEDGNTVLDVGANIGLFTLFVNELWKDLKVYAFEPVPAIFDVLRANVSLYGSENTKLLPFGISDREDTVEFTFYRHSSVQSSAYASETEDKRMLRFIVENQRRMNSSIGSLDVDALVDGRIAGGERVQCRLRTLSDVIREQGIETVDLLKIDAEKSELSVLLGIQEEHWSAIRQVVIEAYCEQVDAIVGLLRQHGFHTALEEDVYIAGSGLVNIYAVREKGRAQVFPRALPKRTTPILLSEDLRHHVAQRLPDYFVPSHIVFLDKIPLTPNNKVDRSALPPVKRTAEREFVAPSSPVEEALTGIWADVLGNGPISVNDNFFERGGHSLNATQVISRIRSTFNLDIPLQRIFELPTVSEFARAVVAEKARRTSDEDLSLLLAELEQIQEAGHERA